MNLVRRKTRKMIRGTPIPETSKTDAEVIEDLNNKVAKLSSYGVRTEVVEAPSHVLMWSNGSKCWFVSYAGGVKQTGSIARLDANEFLAPYRSVVLDRVIPGLDYLPLYKVSFEAKTRGEYGLQ